MYPSHVAITRSFRPPSSPRPPLLPLSFLQLPGLSVPCFHMSPPLLPLPHTQLQDISSGLLGSGCSSSLSQLAFTLVSPLLIPACLSISQLPCLVLLIWSLLDARPCLTLAVLWWYTIIATLASSPLLTWSFFRLSKGYKC
jgi:hypothetical protein